MMYGEDIKWELELLAHKHRDMLCAFSCGNKEELDGVNDFIRNKALGAHDCTSFVLVNTETEDIIAIYSLCCSGIMLGTGPVNLIPAVELKMFALNEKYQHLPYAKDPSEGNLSDSIFSFIASQVEDFTEKQCGAEHIVLYSLPSAKNFYLRNGCRTFTELMQPNGDMFLEGCIPMFFIL